MPLKETFSCCFAPNPKVNHHHDHDDHNNNSHENRLTMVSGSSYIPKKTSRSSLGEDAHFISSSGETIGVADGVGSWSTVNVDAGDYARSLMSNAASAANSSPSLSPKEIIAEAFKRTRIRLGSSTALVATHRDGTLLAANVGDSGYVVIPRGGGVVARSAPQHHGFNRPFQLGNWEGFDRPQCAEESSVAVEEGDVVVAATDGVFDNVYVEDIVRAARKAAEPWKLANEIAKMAYRMSKDPNWNSPFSKDALAIGVARPGGKLDDITVVVGLIVRV